MNVIDKNGERLVFYTFFDPTNRDLEVVEWHKKITEFYGIPWNYVEIDYRRVNHGTAIERTIKKFEHNIQYFAFLDNDCIPLKRNIHEIIYQKIKDKNTLFGGCQNSNHIHREQHHPFIAPSSFCISSELYRKIGYPHLGDLDKRADHTENATFRCQELGYQVCMVYPVTYNKLTKEEMEKSGNPESWVLQKGVNFDIRYGLGTNYGNLFWHGMMQNLLRSKELFIQKCKDIIERNNKIEAIIPCVGYSRLLDLTLENNKKHFDNIIVVTSSKDLETQKICQKHNISIVITERFYENNALFNRGGAINEAIKVLKFNDFVCVLDCDIIIPDDFKENVQLNILDINKLYGCRRFIIKSFHNWVDYKNNIKTKNDFEGLEWGGWGCGYFQLFNMQSERIKGLDLNNLYPSNKTSSNSDIDFLKKFHFNVEEVGKLDLDVIHLGSVGDKHDGTEQCYIKFFDE